MKNENLKDKIVMRRPRQQVVMKKKRNPSGSMHIGTSLDILIKATRKV
jgi:lysyl-tRNA synthetase class I